MKRLKKYFLWFICLFCPALTLKAQSQLSAAIEIDTQKQILKINNKLFSVYRLKEIKSILGQPSRILEDQYQSYIEEFPLNHEDSKTLIPVHIKNLYYIYDSVGIMFIVKNRKPGSEEPQVLKVYFQSPQQFTHRKQEKYIPKMPFKGSIVINGKKFLSGSKLLPDSIDYKIDSFTLFNIQFGATSFATQIDSIYTHNTKPYLRFYLNHPKEQKTSYLEIILSE